MTERRVPLGTLLGAAAERRRPPRLRRHGRRFVITLEVPVLTVALITAVTVVAVALRVTRVVTWPWYLVLAPLWVTWYALTLAVALGAGVAVTRAVREVRGGRSRRER